MLGWANDTDGGTKRTLVVPQGPMKQQQQHSELPVFPASGGRVVYHLTPDPPQPTVHYINPSPYPTNLFQAIHYSIGQENDDDEEDDSEAAMKRKTEERRKTLALLDPYGKSIQSFPILRPNPLVDPEEENEFDEVHLSCDEEDAWVGSSACRNGIANLSRPRPAPLLDPSRSTSTTPPAPWSMNEASSMSHTIYSSEVYEPRSSISTPEPTFPPGSIPEISISFASPTPPTSRPVSQQQPASPARSLLTTTNDILRHSISDTFESDETPLPTTKINDQSATVMQSAPPKGEREPSIFHKLTTSIMTGRSTSVGRASRISSLVAASQRKRNGKARHRLSDEAVDPWDSCEDMLASDTDDISAPATPSSEAFSAEIVYGRDGRPLSMADSYRRQTRGSRKALGSPSVRFSLPASITRRSATPSPPTDVDDTLRLRLAEKKVTGRVSIMDAFFERSMWFQKKKHPVEQTPSGSPPSIKATKMSNRSNPDISVAETNAVYPTQGQTSPPATDQQSPSVRLQWQAIAANRQQARLVQETFDPEALRNKPSQRTTGQPLDTTNDNSECGNRSDSINDKDNGNNSTDKVSTVKSTVSVSLRYPIHTNPIILTSPTTLHASTQKDPGEASSSSSACQRRSSVSSTSSTKSNTSSSAPSTPPPTATSILHRSLTTACVFGQFSPGPTTKSARAAMVPTIVTPSTSLLIDTCGQAATTISPASSSNTLVSSTSSNCLGGSASPDSSTSSPSSSSPPSAGPTTPMTPTASTSNTLDESRTGSLSATTAAGLLQVPPAEGRPLFNRQGGTTHFHGQSSRTKISAVAAAAMAATAKARREGIWPGAPIQKRRHSRYHQLNGDESDDSEMDYDREMVYMASSASTSSSTIRSKASFSSTTAPLTVPSTLSLKKMGDEESKRLLQAMYGSHDGHGGGDGDEGLEFSVPQYRANHHHPYDLLAEQDASDVEEKFMDLPDPSPFEGMCSCRGIVNIVSIVVILLGLILLILGYPIAKFAQKEPDPSAWLESEVSDGPPEGHVMMMATDPKGMIASVLSSSNKNREEQEQEPVEAIVEKLLQSVSNGNSEPLSPPRVTRSRALAIDPDTPLDQRTRVAMDGSEWHIVFSDEFNQEGRSFEPGQDPHWEAVERRHEDHSSASPLEGYACNAVTTKNGHLEIHLSREEVNPSQQQKRHEAERSLPQYKYTSGMLQSWNKLCFQGGILEVSVSLAGINGIQGLMPRVFALGNLARYGYKATMDGMWPYSYSTCDAETLWRLNSTQPAASPSSSGVGSAPQRLSACLQQQSMDSPSPGVGRGAPQIDLLELHQGTFTKPTAIAPPAPPIKTMKRSMKKRQDSSLHGEQQRQHQQFVPGDSERILATEHRDRSSSIPTHIGQGESTTVKTFKTVDTTGNRHGFAVSSLTVASPSSSAGADISSIKQVTMLKDTGSSSSLPSSSPAHLSSGNVPPEQHAEFISVGVEYWPNIESPVLDELANDAYLRFMTDQSWHQPIVESTFHSSAPDETSSSAVPGSPRASMDTYSAQLPQGLLIPQEPMSIVLGLELLQLQQHLQQQSAASMMGELETILSNPALIWPVVMKVDYVRLYQPTHALVPTAEVANAEGQLGAFSASMALSCDPLDHPTAMYIRDHSVAYTDASKKTWVEAGYRSP